jgi:hypothetical protein
MVEGRGKPKKGRDRDGFRDGVNLRFCPQNNTLIHTGTGRDGILAYSAHMRAGSGKGFSPSLCVPAVPARSTAGGSC